jgi:hypothetical protein
MSDSCQHCTVRGNLMACRATPCHTHESWYAQQQDAEIARLRLWIENVATDSQLDQPVPALGGMTGRQLDTRRD